MVTQMANGKWQKAAMKSLNFKVQAVAALAVGALPTANAIMGLPPIGKEGDGVGFGKSSDSGSNVQTTPPPPPVGATYDPDRLEDDEIKVHYCYEEVGDGACWDKNNDFYWFIGFPILTPSPLFRDFIVSQQECANECGNRFPSPYYKLRGFEWIEQQIFDVNGCFCIFDAYTIEVEDIPELWGGSGRDDAIGPVKRSSGLEGFNVPPYYQYKCYTIEECEMGGSSKSGKSGSSKSGKSGSSKSYKKGSYDDCPFENPLAVQYFIYNPCLIFGCAESTLKETAFTSNFVEFGERRLVHNREGVEVATEDPNEDVIFFVEHQGFLNYVFSELVTEWVNKGISPDEIYDVGKDFGMLPSHNGIPCNLVCEQLWLYVIQMEYTCNFNSFLPAYANVAANFMDGFAHGAELDDLNVLKCYYPYNPSQNFKDIFGDVLTEETLLEIGSGGMGCYYPPAP